MTRGRSERVCLTAAVMCVASGVRAGVWNTEPVLGVSADYSSNPGLLYVGHTAETHGAVLIDAPTNYYADALKLSVLPSLRISDSSGYSSLASDYAHLTITGEINRERDSLKATAQAARDSSLYYNYYFNGSTGVRRDTLLADVAWVRAVNERLNLNLDVNSSQVRYGPSGSFTTLNDYRYSSAAPAMSWNVSERSSLTLQGAVGKYESLDASTQSINSNIQIGFTSRLNEQWTASASAGFSRESDKIGSRFGSFESTANGTVFKADLTRQASLLTLTAEASRSLIPSGFAFLSHQDTYQVNASYPWTERWTFGGHVRLLKSQNPQFFSPTIDQRYLDIGLSAVWLMNPHWTLTLLASHVTDTVSPPTLRVAASGCSVQLARHFNSIEWR